MAESVLLADGSNQNSPSVQLVSAREDHSSTAARAPNTFLHTGGEKSEESRYASRSRRGSKREGCRDRTLDTRKEEKFRIFKASVFFYYYYKSLMQQICGMVLYYTTNLVSFQNL